MNHAHSAYLETQIITATPQKLRLLLIEGAIRFANQAVAAYEAGNQQECFDLIARCRDIGSELLIAINPDGHEITNATRSIYGFVIVALAEAELKQSLDKIPGVLRVLEEERITWTQVCELEPHAPAIRRWDNSAEEITAFDAAETLGTAAPSVSQFSLDA